MRQIFPPIFQLYLYNILCTSLNFTIWLGNFSWTCRLYKIRDISPPPLFYLDSLYLQHTAFHSLHKFELFNFHTLDLWMYHSVCFFSHEVHFYFCILYSIILHHYFNFHFDRMMINQVLCIICRYKPLILFEL